jgi:pimeloyl-ACP methyl ester carboxylesterase
MRLAYAVARAESDDRLPDPVVVHFGGPAATLYRMDRVLRSPLWRELRQRRDIIFLDQRGTGYSEPRPCRPLHEFFHDAALLLPAEPETNARAARLAAECRESARAEGVELSAFGGSEAAEDYEDLRSALGYEQWNWYGASYGGRIGQILLRQYPERLRSVILASPAVLGATDHCGSPRKRGPAVRPDGAHRGGME